MKIYDLLNKKRLGKELSKDEINFFIENVTNGKCKDYEISAMLMAICINGMSKQETLNLTLAMASSGEQIDLSGVNGICVDKHSSGGVSDTTTLALAPIVASCGLKVAKMSGRGLGYTGGTIDKLEAIDGYKCEQTYENFIKGVQNIGISLISQTKNIAPADKILYALRDQTATVESIPLIASSIMSKKLASGANIILLDVKYGAGAFMKTKTDAFKLAKTMVEIGKGAGKKVSAVITNMNLPLGNSVGCTLEVMDAIEVLNGAENNLATLSKFFSAKLLNMATKENFKECENKVNHIIKSGESLKKFAELVENQGGNAQQILLNNFTLAPEKVELKAWQDGYISEIDALKLSEVVADLGGARTEVGSSLVHNVGVKILKHYGKKVQKNETICYLFAKNKEDSLQGLQKLADCFKITKRKPKTIKLIEKIIN